ncbi:MAG: phage baseplate assembly protein [Janthinobacterium lividum]
MPDPRFVCTVKANGQDFKSWKSITIKRDFNDMISWFQMACSEGGPLGGAGDSRRLVPGTPVTISLGVQLVLTGAVTTRAASFDANSHDVLIAGRSATADGPESAMPLHPGDFKGYTAEQAARGALQPHGIDLVVKNPPASWSKPFPFLAANPGERVGEFMERIFKMRGAFAWDDENGKICVGQGDPSAATVAELQEGRNILRATFKLDDQMLFGSLSFVGQQPGQGDDMAIRTSQATTQNPGVRQNRTRLEHAEMNGDSQDMASRANIEAAQSAWPSVEASVTVVGWFRPDGKLWGLTDNVSVYSPMGLPNSTGKMTLGVQSVTFSQDGESGTTTTMELKKPELLTSTPFANVQTDGKGGYGDGSGTPAPAAPVTPDYQGPAGIGHA